MTEQQVVEEIRDMAVYFLDVWGYRTFRDFTSDDLEYIAMECLVGVRDVVEVLGLKETA